jgi:hypothetical protein
MRTTASLALAATVVFVFAGCTDPRETPSPTMTSPGAVDSPCVVGTWELDVADYGAQSEEYVLGLGLPIVDFAMSGTGDITFTDDGLVTTDIDLIITGTIVAGDTRVPLDQRSAYAGSGNWAIGDDPDTIDLSNWVNVPDPAVPVDPDAPPIPAIDFTDIPNVTAPCTENELVLQGPDAPISSLWHR